MMSDARARRFRHPNDDMELNATEAGSAARIGDDAWYDAIMASPDDVGVNAAASSAEAQGRPAANNGDVASRAIVNSRRDIDRIPSAVDRSEGWLRRMIFGRRGITSTLV